MSPSFGVTNLNSTCSNSKYGFVRGICNVYGDTCCKCCSVVHWNNRTEEWTSRSECL